MHQICEMRFLYSYLIAYFTYFHGHTGQTPGKWLFNVRVVNSWGLTISYRQALSRSIGALFSEMLYFAGYLMMLFTPYRRTLHDVLAGTFVIRVNPKRWFLACKPIMLGCGKNDLFPWRYELNAIYFKYSAAMFVCSHKIQSALRLQSVSLIS